MKTESVVVEQRIRTTPARVWERISTPEGIAGWWRPGDIAAVVGHCFTMDMGNWGMINCCVIVAEPEKRLVYRFGDFELHWELRQEGDATVLRLEQKGFDFTNPRHRFAFDNMGPGWRNTVLPRLKAELEAV
ncbi:SRPBCC domain-containing protein [Martelella sp. HB161492]|uniref:SRPBCC family protein n=1 Tax=Martelella sp. HB161492 TaxID=2720726 RepID=UPI00158FEC64|nr:SRPBCC domain-containing protein [Martelella sp. HB161492]